MRGSTGAVRAGQQMRTWTTGSVRLTLPAHHVALSCGGQHRLLAFSTVRGNKNRVSVCSEKGSTSPPRVGRDDGFVSLRSPSAIEHLVCSPLCSSFHDWSSSSSPKLRNRTQSLELIAAKPGVRGCARRSPRPHHLQKATAGGVCSGRTNGDRMGHCRLSLSFAIPRPLCVLCTGPDYWFGADAPCTGPDLVHTCADAR